MLNARGRPTFLCYQVSVDPALQRLGGEGWIADEWATSENNRKAKYYPPDPDRPAAARDGDRALATAGGGGRSHPADGVSDAQSASREDHFNWTLPITSSRVCLTARDFFQSDAGACAITHSDCPAPTTVTFRCRQTRCP